MNKVRRSHTCRLHHRCDLLTSSFTDREWLEAVNDERSKQQLDKVSYELFEIIMDRLEKEWFDLVSWVIRDTQDLQF
jgi:hypothetical protein